MFYCDVISTKPLDRKLCFQFRAGCLPLKSFTAAWSTAADDKCLNCTDTEESYAHVLFVCPAYAAPRKAWLTPICRNMGTHLLSVAMRILCSDPSVQCAVSVETFLRWMWTIRSRLLLYLCKWSLLPIIIIICYILMLGHFFKLSIN